MRARITPVSLTRHASLTPRAPDTPSTLSDAEHAGSCEGDPQTSRPMDWLDKAMNPTKKKSLQNKIERRYHGQLNEKVRELRDSVLSFRRVENLKIRDASNTDGNEEDFDGVTPSTKLSEASILTETVNYIRHP
jgi:Helix-loop-helix DNA-binding domain